VFYGVPMVVVFLQARNWTLRFIGLNILFAVLIGAPILWWREWIQQFPEGIPAWKWLLNGNGIRLRPSFFYWMGWERLTKLILGYAGIVVLPLGILRLFRPSDRYNYPAFLWALGIGTLAYIVVFATGNVQHDYYQILTLPVIVLFMGVGMDTIMYYFDSRKQSIIGIVISIAFLISTVWIAWDGLGERSVRRFYWINNPNIVTAGQAVDRLVSENALVIAPYGGDTAFLYQTNRKGWPVGISIEDMVEKGATHYVNTALNDPEVEFIRLKYTVVEETDTYIIAELVEKEPDTL
jgi:hypothetical protein